MSNGDTNDSNRERQTKLTPVEISTVIARAARLYQSHALGVSHI
jgi:hypothetical protein